MRGEAARSGHLFDSGQVREALGLRNAPGTPRRYSSVSTDTRTLEPGALFVALRGERHDGVEFLVEAERRGARGAIVPRDRPLPPVELEWFPVADPKAALGTLAGWHRRRRKAQIVAITGSSGKTTVKEMAAAALATRFVVHRTAGNRNSLVGLPLSIFEAPPEAEVWVLELGASAPGEIGRLAEIAVPEHAVVTTVGPAHLEAFHTVEEVLREKLTLLERSGPGAAIVGERPEALPRAARSLRPDVIVAGLGPDADVRPDRWEVAAEEVRFERAGVSCRIPAGGEHHLRDALLALAVAEALGVSPAETAEGLATFRPLGMRSRLLRLGDLTVIADCYNANPESFAAAIEYLTGAFPERRLVAVVGTMLELGTHEERAHREVVQELVNAGFDLVAATGAFVSAVRGLEGARNGSRFLAAPDPDALWDGLAESLRGDEVVLVKGSRGVRLERIVERLTAKFGEGAD